MWPEYGHAATDFTCDEVVGPLKAYAYLEEKFGTGHVSEKDDEQGQRDFSGKEITHKPAGY
jgi:S-adenosylmethionine/arginine decarboxylase-like enzyme